MSETATISEVGSVSIRNVQYTLSVTASLPCDPNSTADTPPQQQHTQGNLHIQLHSVQTGNLWTADYDAEYVEVITKKTGNFKRFPVFVEMLISSLKQTSLTVLLDLLTQDDLEALKRGGAALNVDNKQRSKNLTEDDAVPGSKRYLILTYAVAFDRIHYPLPLSWQGRFPGRFPGDGRHVAQTASNNFAYGHDHGGRPSDVTSVAVALRKQVDTLQSERKAHMEEITKLLRTNDRISHQLKHLTTTNAKNQKSLNANIQSLQKDNERLLREKAVSDSAFARLHAEAEREVRCIQTEFDELCKEIEDWRGVDGYLEKGSKRHQREEQILKLQKLVQGLIKELHKTKLSTKRALSAKSEYIDELLAELESAKSKQASLKARCRQLSETEKQPPPSTYRPIKSRPIRLLSPAEPISKPSSYAKGLKNHESPYARQSTTRQRANNSSRRNSPANSPSRSPIRRFDPTEYIQRREQNLRDRRARSLSATSAFRAGSPAVPVTRSWSQTRPLGRSGSAGSANRVQRSTLGHENGRKSAYEGKIRSSSANKHAQCGSPTDALPTSSRRTATSINRTRNTGKPSLRSRYQYESEDSESNHSSIPPLKSLTKNISSQHHGRAKATRRRDPAVYNYPLGDSRNRDSSVPGRGKVRPPPSRSPTSYTKPHYRVVDKHLVPSAQSDTSLSSEPEFHTTSRHRHSTYVSTSQHGSRSRKDRGPSPKGKGRDRKRGYHVEADNIDERLAALQTYLLAQRGDSFEGE